MIKSGAALLLVLLLFINPVFADEIMLETEVTLNCEQGVYVPTLTLRNMSAAAVKIPDHFIPVTRSGRVASYRAFELVPGNRRELKPIDLVVNPPPYIKLESRSTYEVEFLNYAFHGLEEALDRSPVVVYWHFNDYRDGGEEVTFSGQVRGLIYFPKNRRFFPNTCPTILSLEDR